MTNEIVPFDTASVSDAIRAKIRLEVVNLIPETAWKEMIEREVKAFMEPTPATRDYYGGIIPAQPSGCAQIIRDVIGAKVKEITKEKLGEFMAVQWSNDLQTQTVSKAVIEMATQAAPQILAELMKAFVQHAVVSLRNNGGM
jgi:hypothetical protein